MSALGEIIPKRGRLIVYAVALLGLIVLGALAAGYAAIGEPMPRQFVFAAAVWGFIVGPAGLGLATLSNLAGPPESKPAAQAYEVKLNVDDVDAAKVLAAIRGHQKRTGQKVTI